MRFCDRTVFIAKITELDRSGGTSGLASCDYVAINDLTTAVFSSIDLGLFNTLNTVRAFFHHTATTHGDFGVQHQCLQFAVGRFDVARERIDSVTRSDVFVVVEVIETANFKRTVVGTVTSTDATVVSHRIDAFLRVNRRRDRANLFTRSRFAVHAGNRLLNDVRVVLVALEIAVNSQPVHFAAIKHLFAANNRHVVFALTSHHASTAADALAQVDRHAPLGQTGFFPIVRRVFQIRNRFGERRLHCVFAIADFFTNRRNMWFLGCAHCELGNLAEQLQRSFADQVETSRFGFCFTTIVDRPVILGGGDFIFGVIGTRFDFVRQQTCVGRSDWRNVHTNDWNVFGGVTTYVTDVGSSITHRDCYHSGSTSWHLVNRQQHFLAFDTQSDALAMTNIEYFCRRRAQHGCVVPRHLGQCLRHLLQPAVVGESTVVQSIRCSKDDFKIVLINLVVGKGNGSVSRQLLRGATNGQVASIHRQAFGKSVVQ